MKQRKRIEEELKTAPLVLAVPQKRRRYWYGAIALLIVLGLAAGIVFRLRSGQRAQLGGPRGFAGGPQVVGVATAATGSIPIVLGALGTVTPLATVTVKTQVSGYLTEIGFKEGQMVKKGDFIAQVDPRPYQVLLAQYEAQLARDRALLQDAEVNLARYETLFAQDSIAKQTLDTQRATVHQDLAAVQMDVALIDTQRLNLTYCHIVAPVDGRVGLRQVDVGNYIQSSDPNGIVVIAQLQPISVLFTLPEDNLAAVMKRLTAGAQLPVTAYDRTNSRSISEGVLETVDNQVDTTTGTVKLRATFPNRDLALFPQQFVNARLLVDTVRGVVVVPNPAVQRGAPGTFVYLVSQDHIVSIRPVSLGPADDKLTAVLSGLDPGDAVVVDGTDRLRDGDRVTWNGPGGAPLDTVMGRAAGEGPHRKPEVGTLGGPKPPQDGQDQGNGTTGGQQGPRGETWRQRTQQGSGLTKPE
jgi:multidrug efflux system membrane fusion protein